MNLKYVLPLFVFIPTVQCKDTAPVIFLDYDGILGQWSVYSNPFNKMKREYFMELLKGSQKSNCVIIFAEYNLSTEDLSATDNVGKAYKNLQGFLKDKRAKYIPAVTQPFHAIQQVFPEEFRRVVYVDIHRDINLPKGLDYMFVYFKDTSNLTRVQALRNHDVLMYKIYKEIRIANKGSVVAFYVGQKDPIELEKMNAYYSRPEPKALEADEVLIASANALFRLSGVTLISTSVSKLNLGGIVIPKLANEKCRTSTLSTSIAYIDLKMQFNFKLEAKGWLLNNVILMEGDEEVGRTEMHVGAPINNSYVCAEPLTIINQRDGSSIIIPKYQIEPSYPCGGSDDDFSSTTTTTEDPNSTTTTTTTTTPPPPGERRFLYRRDDANGTSEGGNSTTGNEGGGNSTSNTQGNNTSTNRSDTDDSLTKINKKFGSPVNCGPYFNIHILSGLVIVGVCLGILTVGVTMLFNCTNNSKFDDPQGKELISQADTGNN